MKKEEVIKMPLVNTKEMFKKAYEGGYAIGAFNCNNMEIVQAITEAAKKCNSPVILQVSAGARKYAKPVYLRKLVEAAVEDTGLPIVLHLDHGADFEICKDCIDGGFTSVMIDASSKSFEENIAITRKVVEYAHAHVPYVTVEAELGTLSGVEDEFCVDNKNSKYTDPMEAKKFLSQTKVNSLAIAIGTSHGAYKFSGKQSLRIDILQKIENALGDFPIVLHGASTVNNNLVEKINNNGGEVKNAKGVLAEELYSICRKNNVCKVNVDSSPDLARQFGIFSIPTLILFKDGEKINQISGFQSVASLKQFIGIRYLYLYTKR